MIQAYLDHIGIAVKPASRLAELLKILGLPISGQEEVPREQVRVDWVPLPAKQGKIELLQGSSPESAISKYLAKNGKDGIHHLSFRVQDIAAAMAAISAAGFRLVYPEARDGADHCLVNFVHPASTGGILIEISQRH